MTTNLKNFINETKERWIELDILIEKAKAVEEVDPKFYEVLCRSSTVLILAHLEGFYKGLVKSIIDDLNDYLTFKYIPKKIRLSLLGHYCEDERKANNLLDNLLFDQSIKLETTPFLPEKNKNLSVEVIDYIFSQLGFDKGTFHKLDVPKIQECFELETRELKEKKELFFSIIDSDCSQFPYTIDLYTHQLLKEKKDRTKNPKNCFWHTFIDSVNMQRHHIAHGEIFNNTTSVHEFEKNRLKAEIVQYILSLYASHHIAELVHCEKKKHEETLEYL